MHDIDRDRITEAVIRSFDKSDDARLKQVLARLVTHLHAFARDIIDRVKVGSLRARLEQILAERLHARRN